MWRFQVHWHLAQEYVNDIFSFIQSFLDLGILILILKSYTFYLISLWPLDLTFHYSMIAFCWNIWLASPCIQLKFSLILLTGRMQISSSCKFSSCNGGSFIHGQYASFTDLRWCLIHGDLCLAANSHMLISFASTSLLYYKYLGS